MNEQTLDTLYARLGGEQSEYNLGSPDVFRTAMADPANRRTLWENAHEKYNLGTYEEYTRILMGDARAGEQLTAAQTEPVLGDREYQFKTDAGKVITVKARNEKDARAKAEAELSRLTETKDRVVLESDELSETYRKAWLEGINYSPTAIEEREEQRRQQLIEARQEILSQGVTPEQADKAGIPAEGTPAFEVAMERLRETYRADEEEFYATAQRQDTLRNEDKKNKVLGKLYDDMRAFGASRFGYSPGTVLNQDFAAVEFIDPLLDMKRGDAAYANLGITQQDLLTVAYDSGYLIDPLTLESSKSQRAEFDTKYRLGLVGPYHYQEELTLEELEVPSDMGGALPFYEKYLGTVNEALIPTTDEQMQEAQALMPSALSTYEDAQSYYQALGQTLDEAKYKNIAGWFLARDKARSATMQKAALTNSLSEMLTTVASAPEAEREQLQEQMFEALPEMVKQYNQATYMLGGTQTAANAADLISLQLQEEMQDNAERSAIAYSKTAEAIALREQPDELVEGSAGYYWNQATRSITQFSSSLLVDGMTYLTDAFRLIEGRDMRDYTIEQQRQASEAIKQEALDRAGDPFYEGTGDNFLYALLASRDSEELFARMNGTIGVSMSSLLAEYKKSDLRIRPGLGTDLADMNITKAVQKYNNDEITGEQLGAVIGGGVAEVLPQIAMQIGMTYLGVPAYVMPVTFGLSGAGSTYTSLQDKAHLSTGEKMLYSTLVGAGEGMSEYIFRGQETLAGNMFRKMAGKEPVSAAGKRIFSFGKGTDKAWTALKSNPIFKYGEEGFEEVFANVIEQSVTNYAETQDINRNLDVLTQAKTQPGADIESINVQMSKLISRREEIKFDWHETADAFILGALAGNIQLATVKSASFIASRVRMRPQMILQSRYRKLAQEFNETKDETRRGEIKREMSEIEEQSMRLVARELKFMENMSDEDVEQIRKLNRQILQTRDTARAIRVQAQKLRDEGKADVADALMSQISLLEQKAMALFEQKFTVESAYSQEQSYVEDQLLDDDTLSFIDEVGKTDTSFQEYGDVVPGQTSTELTTDNAASIIQEIINSGRIQSNKYSTREQIVQGLRNVGTIISGMKPGSKVVLHGTLQSLKDAEQAAYPDRSVDRTSVPRGLVVDGDTIHLYLPALKANTAYHEQHHVVTNQALSDAGIDPSSALAASLVNSIGDVDTLQELLSFVESYILSAVKNGTISSDLYNALEIARQAGDAKGIIKVLGEMMQLDPTVANEILTEIKANISSGQTSVEYKKGLTDGLRMYVQKLFKNVKNPILRDVVHAIEQVTSDVAEGRQASDAALTEAGRRLGEKSGIKMAPPPQDKEAWYQFVGVNAKLNAEILDRVGIAEAMETNGKDALAIKMATGWERGVDNKWRYEIPDIELKDFGTVVGNLNRRLDPPLRNEEEYTQNNFVVTLGAIVEGGMDSPLLQAYPSLARIPVFTDDYIPANALASHTYQENTLGYVNAIDSFGLIDMSTGNYLFPEFQMDGGDLVNSIYLNEKNPTARQRVTGTLVHEIQHLIQRIEGFSQGGNSGSAFMSLPPSDLVEVLVNFQENQNKKVDDLATASRFFTAARELFDMFGQAKNMQDLEDMIYSQYGQGQNAEHVPEFIEQIKRYVRGQLFGDNKVNLSVRRKKMRDILGETALAEYASLSSAEQSPDFDRQASNAMGLIVSMVILDPGFEVVPIADPKNPTGRRQYHLIREGQDPMALGKFEREGGPVRDDLIIENYRYDFFDTEGTGGSTFMASMKLHVAMRQTVAEGRARNISPEAYENRIGTTEPGEFYKVVDEVKEVLLKSLRSDRQSSGATSLDDVALLYVGKNNFARQQIFEEHIGPIQEKLTIQNDKLLDAMSVSETLGGMLFDYNNIQREVDQGLDRLGGAEAIQMLIKREELLSEMDAQASDFIQENSMDLAMFSPPVRFDAYRRLGGEVEARNVEARMSMSMEERRQALAESTEDFPRVKQISSLRRKGPAAQPQTAQEVRSQVQSGPRIGQGFAASASGVNASSHDGSLNVSIQYLREKDPDAYVKNANYLMSLDIVKGARKFKSIPVMRAAEKRANPKKLERNLGRADEVYSVFVQQAAGNLVALHDMFSADVRETATLWYDGANILAQEMAGRYGISLQAAAGVIAALSPQKDWYQNLRLAELVAQVSTDAGDFVFDEQLVQTAKNLVLATHQQETKGNKTASQIAKSDAKRDRNLADIDSIAGKKLSEISEFEMKAYAVRAYAESRLDMTYHIISPSGQRRGKAVTLDGRLKTAGFGSRVEVGKAIAIAQSGMMTQEELGGMSQQDFISMKLGRMHKIRNFYNNIADPTNPNDATIDTHAVGAALFLPVSGSAPEVLANFGSKKAGEKVGPGNSAKHGVQGVYFAYLDAYREAARQLELLPRQVQSITWEAVRLLFTDTFKRKAADVAALRDIHKQHANGQISIEELRAAVTEYVYNTPAKGGQLGVPSWADVQVARTEPGQDTDTGGVSVRGSGRGRADVGGGDQGVPGGRLRNEQDVVRDANNVKEQEEGSDSEAQAQQALVITLADALTTPGVTFKMEGRGSNRRLVAVQSSQLGIFAPNKKYIVDTLVGLGYTKEQAERYYTSAVQYGRGRRVGRAQAAKAERKAERLSDRAEKLRQELTDLKGKVKSIKEFLQKARAIVNERMSQEKGKGPKTSTVFSKKQINKLFSIFGITARASAARLAQDSDSIIDGAIAKLVELFDEQDAKLAVEEYIRAVNKARNLQKTILGKARQRDLVSYSNIARIVGEINPTNIPSTGAYTINEFIELLEDVRSSMMRASVRFDKEQNIYVAEPSELKNIEQLMVRAGHAKVVEQDTIRQDLLNKAGRAYDKLIAEGGQTTMTRDEYINQEFDRLFNKLLDSRLTFTSQRINSYAEANNLDPTNVVDLEQIMSELAEQDAQIAELKKAALVRDALLPAILINLGELMDNSHFARMLGITDPNNPNLAELEQRLMKLDKHQLLAIEFKINDYIVNGSVFGVGSMADLVYGKVDLPAAIQALVNAGVRSRKTVRFPAWDYLQGYIRSLFPVDNVTIAKIRTAIGESRIRQAKSVANAMHIELARMIETKVQEIQRNGGSVTEGYDNAIAQIYSMARQMPQSEDYRQNPQLWLKQLRDSMDATIKYYSEQMGKTYTRNEVQRLQDARDFLFSVDTLEELIAKVEQERSDIVELVDFVVQIHEMIREPFAEYTEAYVGKELDLVHGTDAAGNPVPVYTPFKVRQIKTGNETVDDELSARKKMLDDLRESGLNHFKKVAGATYTREDRAVGPNTIMDLDFLMVNINTLRENTFLMNVIGPVIAHQHAMGSEAMSKLVSEVSTRNTLREQVMRFITGELTKAPSLFTRTAAKFSVGGWDIRIPNPLEMFRSAAVTKAFGGFIRPILAQSAVALSVPANVKSVESFMYFISAVSELTAASIIRQDENGKLVMLKDPKAKLANDGRYELLKNMTVFLRDYQTGAINPFDGRIEFNTPYLRQVRDTLQRDISLRTLRVTDKIMALGAALALYADYVVTVEGRYKSVFNIDWAAEAANPSLEALAHSENIVSKDMSTSSADEAASIYRGDNRQFIQIVMAFQSFAINSKRTLLADAGRVAMGNLKAKRDGALGMLGTLAGLYGFQYAATVCFEILKYAAQSLFDDDDETWEEISEKVGSIIFGKTTLQRAGAKTVLDAIPLPSMSTVEAVVTDEINYRVLFNEADIRERYDSAGLSREELFELFLREDPRALPVYGPSMRRETGLGKGVDSMLGLIGLLGPAGDYAQQLTLTTTRALSDSDSYIDSRGNERFIRPEHRDAFKLSNQAQAVMHVLNLGGIGVKEIDYMAKALDDEAIKSALSRGEDAAAAELLADFFLDGPSAEGIENAGEGLDRLLEIIAEQEMAGDYGRLLKETSAERFERALEGLAEETLVFELYPDMARKHGSDVRRLAKKPAREILGVLAIKKNYMDSADYVNYEAFVQSYIAVSSPTKFEDLMLEMLVSDINKTDEE